MEDAPKRSSQKANATGKRRGRGRPVENRLGECLAVLFSLTREGSITSPKDIARLLGIDDMRSAEILNDLSQDREGRGDDDNRSILPLTFFGSGEVICIGSGQIQKRVRLTQDQARACSLALDQLGFEENDPLRASLEEAFFPKGYVPGASSTTAPLSEEMRETLHVCALSIARGKRLFGEDSEEDDGSSVSQPAVLFDYRGKNNNKPLSRKFVPLSIRLTNGNWFVDGFDCDASASRSFELKSMSNARIDPRDKPEKALVADAEKPLLGFVKLSCDPKVKGKVLALNGAKVEGADGERIIVKVPYYRGDWLARQILALGKDVRFTNVPDTETNDEVEGDDSDYLANNDKLAKKMREIANNDLAGLEKYRKRNR